MSTIDLELTVKCSDCEEELPCLVKIEDKEITLYVTPCEKCLDETREQAVSSYIENKN